MTRTDEEKLTLIGEMMRKWDRQYGDIIEVLTINSDISSTDALSQLSAARVLRAVVDSLAAILDGEGASP